MIYKFNEWLVNTLATSLSSISFVYICIIIDVTELLLQPPQTIQEWCTFLSQTVIQLVALPVLAFVSKLEGAKSERILRETHDEACEIHKETHSKLDQIINLLNKG